MHLELTDEQTEALIRVLSRTIDDDRYPLSPRIVALKEILGGAAGTEPGRRTGNASRGGKGRCGRAGVFRTPVGQLPRHWDWAGVFFVRRGGRVPAAHGNRRRDGRRQQSCRCATVRALPRLAKDD